MRRLRYNIKIRTHRDNYTNNTLESDKPATPPVYTPKLRLSAKAGKKNLKLVSSLGLF